MEAYGKGYGAVWLDLLATLRGRYRPHQDDEIGAPTGLATFLAGHRLAPMTPPTDADVAEWQATREALHCVTVATHGGRPADPQDLATLDAALRPLAPVAVLRAERGLVASAPRDAADALARIVQLAVADLDGPRADLLRPCGDETCSGFFLDVTGRRRWCSDARCGSRKRVQAHRARAHATVAEPPTAERGPGRAG